MTRTFIHPLEPGDAFTGITGMASEAWHYQACRFVVNDYQDDMVAALGIELPERFEHFASKRKAEYLAGRHCARSVLSQLGYPQAQIRNGGDRAPIWPQDIIASISHSHELACCIALRRADTRLRGIGIDIENIMPTERADRLYSHIVSEQEKHFLQSSDCPWATALSIVFSAKESLFKTLYPEVRQYFDFLHAEVIDFNPAAGRLTLKLLKQLTANIVAGSEYQGNYVLGEDRVRTLVYY